MKPNTNPGTESGRQIFCRTAVVLGFAFAMASCATVVPVTSDPPGAAVSVNGQPLGPTPLEWQADTRSGPASLTFSLPDYFPEEVTYSADTPPGPIAVTMAPTKREQSFEITSDPAGATLTLDGSVVGTTPATIPVVFTRSSKQSAWNTRDLTVSMTDRQSETVRLNASLTAVPTVNLALLRAERTYSITAANQEGAALNAEVTLNGEAVGQTPLSLPLTYQRSNKDAAWPTFALSVEIPGQYKPTETVLSFGRNTGVPLQLVAITEIPTSIFAPEVVLTPTGAALQFNGRETIGTLRTSDDSTAISELKAVTNYQRQDMRPANRIETINSFTLTPDGQNVIYSLSDTDEEGNRYANLFIKRADDASGGVSRLTQGTRYYDTQPFIANDGSNYLAFTSNRGDRNKPDIFRVNIVENRLSGGISRLTNDNRFNFYPSFGDSNRQLFYLSMEPAYPRAEIQLGSVRFDGSLPTQLPVYGEQINNTYPDTIYYVKTDADTGKQQIYSVTTEGKLETALINLTDFRNANCFQPYVSSDGQRILFVSDRTTDSNDRPNNDIYVINADGTNLLRLTYNESDDTHPMWSPTEEGVVYFLSTRGGATNIWRFRLVTGR